MNSVDSGTKALRLQQSLCFDLGPERYAVSRDRVAAVGAIEHVERVAGTPPGIYGLWQRDGRVYTVLDLPGLLLRDSWEGKSWAIRLVRPFPYLALRVPADLRMQPLPFVPPGDGWLTTVQYRGKRTHRIEIQPLIDLVAPDLPNL